MSRLEGKIYFVPDENNYGRNKEVVSKIAISYTRNMILGRITRLSDLQRGLLKG